MKNHIGPCSSCSAKGYGRKNESVETLLDRIEWSNHYPKRSVIFIRYIFYAIFIAFITSIIYEEKIRPKNMLQSTIVIWTFLLGANSFFSHHSDKFTSYFIDNNLSKIRRKLRVKSNIGSLVTNKVTFPNSHDCITFVY